MPDGEEWRPVVGYPGYEVSSVGRVRSVERDVFTSNGQTRHYRGFIIKQYPYGRHYADGRHMGVRIANKTLKVHRLMAEAFLPNPENLPLVRHLNDVKADNRIENLAWGTNSDNVLDAIVNGKYVRPARTHCSAGHALIGDNVRIVRNGLVCKECRRLAQIEYRARQRGSA